jgi:hypothetical protein
MRLILNLSDYLIIESLNYPMNEQIKISHLEKHIHPISKNIYTDLPKNYLKIIFYIESHARILLLLSIVLIDTIELSQTRQ